MAARPQATASTLLAALVDGNPDEAPSLLQQATARLGLREIQEIEQAVYDLIDARYPDDNRSLLNRNYREGRRRKRALNRAFNEFYDRRVQSLVAGYERVHDIGIEEVVGSQQDAAYLRQRDMRRLRRRDEEEDLLLPDQLVNDEMLRVEEIRAKWKRDERRDGWEHELDVMELTSELKRAEAKVTQPFELQKMLVQAFSKLGDMRERALEEAMRNPGLAAELRSRALAYAEMQQQTQRVIRDLSQSDLPEDARKALIDDLIKRMGRATEDYLNRST